MSDAKMWKLAGWFFLIVTVLLRFVLRADVADDGYVLALVSFGVSSIHERLGPA